MSKQRIFSRRWLLFLRWGLVLVIFIFVGRACVFRPSQAHPGWYFNQGANAVWLGVEWVNELHSPEEVAILADVLTKQQIRYVFVYTTYLKPDGQFNPTYAYATEFVQMLRPVNPALNVQAWIGLPLAYVDLSDAVIHTSQK